MTDQNEETFRIYPVRQRGKGILDQLAEYRTSLEAAIKQRDQALAASAAREIAMRDRAAERIESIGFSAGLIRALPLSPDGQQALNEMLADAWDDGWFGKKRGKTVPDNPYRRDAT